MTQTIATKEDHNKDDHNENDNDKDVHVRDNHDIHDKIIMTDNIMTDNHDRQSRPPKMLTMKTIVGNTRTFLVADTQLYKRLCPSVRRSVCQHESKSGKTSVFEAFCVSLCWKGGWVGRWVLMGVGCPNPPVRNDIATPRHLFFFLFLFFSWSAKNDEMASHNLIT